MKIKLEKEIIEKAGKRDKKSFLKIYNTYKDLVFQNCYMATLSKDEAMDLFQEIWLKIYLGIKKLKNFDKFNEWMKAIIRNTIINYNKKMSKFQALNEDYEIIDKNEDILKHIEIKDNFFKFLNKCTITERYILYLKYYEEATVNEISEILGISSGAVKMRINRVLRRLKGNDEGQ